MKHYQDRTSSNQEDTTFSHVRCHAGIITTEISTHKITISLNVLGNKKGTLISVPLAPMLEQESAWRYFVPAGWVRLDKICDKQRKRAAHLHWRTLFGAMPFQNAQGNGWHHYFESAYQSAIYERFKYRSMELGTTVRRRQNIPSVTMLQHSKPWASVWRTLTRPNNVAFVATDRVTTKVISWWKLNPETCGKTSWS